MPHQRAALKRAAEALDAIRPHASTDLGSAFERSPDLVREAGEGRSHAALRTMKKEAEVRTDPFQRADRFVEGWQQLQLHRDELVRDGDLRGAKQTAQEMARIARGLERDGALQAILFGRAQQLGLEELRTTGRSLSHDLIASISPQQERAPDHSRGFDR